MKTKLVVISLLIMCLLATGCKKREIGLAVFGIAVAGLVGYMLGRQEQSVLQNVPTGQTVVWTENNVQQSMTPTTPMYVANNQYCRDYSRGGDYSGYHTSCMTNNGSWQIVR